MDDMKKNPITRGIMKCTYDPTIYNSMGYVHTKTTINEESDQMLALENKM